MMKTAILLCVLAVLAVGQAAVYANAGSRSNMQVGYVRPGDRLLNRTYISRNPIPNAIQYQDYTYQGNRTTNISAVYATEVGYTQYGSARIISGGPGWNYVSIRAQSYRGYGYYYMIEVWGR